MFFGFCGVFFFVLFRGGVCLFVCFFPPERNVLVWVFFLEIKELFILNKG